MDWVRIAIKETFEGIAKQQKLNAELEAERLSGLQDQHEDEETTSRRDEKTRRREDNTRRRETRR